jgi:DNA-binding response OmpR family regulator
MKRVLFLEPDRALAKTYQTYLQNQGYHVDIAADAQAGIELADEHAPDVVVLELQLAGHNGVEFLHELRSYTEWQRIPVVIHTLLPLDRLQKYQANWQEFGVSQLCCKTTTNLADLGRYVQVAVA